MIGFQLGGWGKRLNMVPQNSNFNRGNWKHVEDAAAACKPLGRGQLVYWVEVRYPAQ